MISNGEEREKSATDEIETFKVGLHPLPRVDAPPEEVQKFIAEMPFSEKDREEIEEAMKAMEEEESKSVEGET